MNYTQIKILDFLRLWVERFSNRPDSFQALPQRKYVTRYSLCQVLAMQGVERSLPKSDMQVSIRQGEFQKKHMQHDAHDLHLIQHTADRGWLQGECW